MENNNDQSVKYERLKLSSSIISIFTVLGVPFILIITGFSIDIRSFIKLQTESDILGPSIFIIIIVLLMSIITLPNSYYSGFFLEKKFGLNRMNFWRWLLDWTKSLTLEIILSVITISVIYGLIRSFPENWWFIASVILAIFSMILLIITPVILLPMFYKFEPLPEGDLKNRLMNLADNLNTSINGIFIWKIGEKTSKSNAAVTGLGGTRRIIIADTLIETMTPEEIEVVMAHELGHHVKKDIWKGILVQIILIFLSLYGISILLESFYERFGLSEVSDYAGIPLLILFTALVSLVSMPVAMWFSRRSEKNADIFALEITGMKVEFCSAMQKLAEQNLSRKNPNKLVKWIFYSHPPIEDRIELAKKYF